MKRVIAISAAFVVSYASLVSAQTSSMSKPLADVAKAEEARRKDVKKPAKVYTNGNLRPDASGGAGSPPSSTGAPVNATNPSPDSTTPATPTDDAAPAKNQAYWAGRIKTARDQVQRTQLFADSLQTRINSLTTDFVNRDDPAQRAKIETDRQAALAELDRVRKELADQTKAIAAIEEEARRAGVPSGWLRPGA